MIPADAPRMQNLVIALLLFAANVVCGATVTVDVCIYGSTPSGIAAAVQSVRMGKSVIIVTPDQHLGGMSSSGLGFADTGNTAVIGGIAREFHQRIWQHYEVPSSWKWQVREKYGNRGQDTTAKDDTAKTMWVFEPHVAQQVFESFLQEYKIPIYRDEWLDRTHGVRKRGTTIGEITTLSGKRFAAKMFIDATYEADLMAAAGVDYHVGREAQNVYGERWNGVQVGVLHHRHHFGVLKQPVSPYVVPGDPQSGVIWGVSAVPPGEFGAGDKKIQAYCYRLCLTDQPENRAPIAKPAGYDSSRYELLLRIFVTGWRETFNKFDLLPNRKTDVNNHGPMSFDFIGGNYDYPEASYERRRDIIRAHRDYQQGWLYFIANDPRVPSDVQQRMQQWGLPKDEFATNGHWPYQLYIREARRMIGAYVMTEQDILKQRVTPDSVGMGSYTIDSHNVQRYISPEGHVQNEGDIGVATKGPYAIVYGALVPKRGQADNLFVTSCLSSSHIAFGSIRMEPVLMILGQSAATAAVLALDGKISVQEVSYEKLRARLIKDGQILEFSSGAAKSDGKP
ncbi:MAG: FAD-dependent oxidoreductase [Verrucomicrobiota bacterium]